MLKGLNLYKVQGIATSIVGENWFDVITCEIEIYVFAESIDKLPTEDIYESALERMETQECDNFEITDINKLDNFPLVWNDPKDLRDCMEGIAIAMQGECKSIQTDDSNQTF